MREIKINDNATNGDVFKEVFTNCQVDILDNEVCIRPYGYSKRFRIERDFWDSKYVDKKDNHTMLVF